MACTTELTASHLSPADVVGRFVQVEGSLEFDESEGDWFEAYVSKWVTGGGRVLDRGPAEHELIVEGMRRVRMRLLCSRNVGETHTRAFREIHGVSQFVTRAEALSAAADRYNWGERIGGGAQLEVTVFAVRGLAGEDSAEELQMIARTLSRESKDYAKKLAPALFEHRGDFKWRDTAAEALSRDWARAAARSVEFGSRGMSVAAGVEWVRSRVGQTSADASAPKNKVKLVAPGARARTFTTPDLRQGRMLFPAPASRGTRLKIELKQRKPLGGTTTNLGRLDIVIDNIVVPNAAYPTGWLPLTHGKGDIQIRLYLLDPYAEGFDPAKLASLPSDLNQTKPTPVDAPETATGDFRVVEKSADTAVAATQDDLSTEDKSTDDAQTTARDVHGDKSSVAEHDDEKSVTTKEETLQAVDDIAPMHKPPPPPPPRKKPPPPPLKPRPSLAADLASQIATGASTLRKSTERPQPPPPAPSQPSIFDDLAAKIQKIRSDVAADDDDDDEYD